MRAWVPCSFYSKAAMERAMKVQEIILRVMAKKITWWQAAEIIGISDRAGVGDACAVGRLHCAAVGAVQAAWYDRQTYKHVHAASRPAPSTSSGQALAKNARMRHALREWRTETSLDGPPAQAIYAGRES
jgi:hypothetical protein